MPDPNPPTIDYASPSPNDREWVSAKTYSSPLEAELAAELLRREGIQCRLEGLTTNATLGVYGPGIAKITIRVPEEEQESARRMLDAIEAKRKSRLERRAKCPRCGGAGRRISPTYKKWLWVMLFALITLMFIFQNGYVCFGIALMALMVTFLPFQPLWCCEDCGNRWSAPEPEEFDDEDEASTR